MAGGYLAATTSVRESVHGPTQEPIKIPGGAGGARTHDRQIMRKTDQSPLVLAGSPLPTGRGRTGLRCAFQAGSSGQ